MRIGVVTTSYPRTPGEAAGSFVAAHVEALRSLGHRVEVIGAHTITSELFYGAGAPEELERNRPRSYVRAARFSARLAIAVSRRARDWDQIIAHWLAPSALAAVPSRAPLLAIAHGGDIHTLRRLRLLAPTLHVLRARRARLAFVSEELRAIARAAAPELARYLDRAMVQPMGIDVARFAALARDRDPSTTDGSAAGSTDDRIAGPPRPMILVVARLVPVKGVDVALVAARQLRTPAELVIAGDGPERDALHELAGTQGLHELERTRSDAHATTRLPHCTAARFVGAVDAATRDRLLREAAVVVVPSRVLPSGRSEGTPMIALEALAAGVPVVASAVGGLAELPGITRVRPDDPRALTAAIERVLATPPPRTDVAHLDWRLVSARLLDHARTGSEPRADASCEAGDST